MKRLSLIVFGTLALACSQAPADKEAPQAAAEEPERAESKIGVQLEQAADGCVCTHPVEGDRNEDGKDEYKMHVSRGDLVSFSKTAAEPRSTQLPKRYALIRGYARDALCLLGTRPCAQRAWFFRIRPIRKR